MSTSSSSRRSNASVLPSNRSGPFIKSSMTSSSSRFASSTSYYSSSTNAMFKQARAISPPRVRLHAPPTPNPSIRFPPMDARSGSPSRSIAAGSPRSQVVQKTSHSKRATCMCSPTTHPGSFRCALHKNVGNNNNRTVSSSIAAYSPNRLNMRRSAMTNSLVRINTVEGDLVKRALAALIRPSSHHHRRRAAFQPRPSRLSNMSKARDMC